MIISDFANSLWRTSTPAGTNFKLGFKKDLASNSLEMKPYLHDDLANSGTISGNVEENPHDGDEVVVDKEAARNETLTEPKLANEW